MQRGFLQAYFQAFDSIEGWFKPDAALLFMAYNQLLAGRGVRGHTLEIGVHYGLSAITVAALRGPGKRFCAVDLFENLQQNNISSSGGGDRGRFERNLRRFHPDTGFLRVFARPSSELTAADLGPGFSFCHIDGGHSCQETYHDLRLCHAVLNPGGLLALDDYFNPEFPGVSEGAIKFKLDYPDALRPLAIGYSKVLLQKTPAESDLNDAFRCAFPAVEHKIVRLWDAPAMLFPSALGPHIDLHASTPQCLAPVGAIAPRATFAVPAAELRASPGQAVPLPVTVSNTSGEVFPAGEKVFGLSYHLQSASGRLLRHDNARAWLLSPLDPGQSVPLVLEIRAPDEPGQYQLEIDLVWEQVMWFKDVGNPTALVQLVVR